jgi:hypothetical protein
MLTESVGVMMQERVAQSVPLASVSEVRDVVFLSKATPGDDEFALWLAPKLEAARHCSPWRLRRYTRRNARLGAIGPRSHFGDPALAVLVMMRPSDPITVMPCSTPRMTTMGRTLLHGICFLRALAPEIGPVANEIGELSTRRPGKPSGDKTVGKRRERQIARRLFD